MIFSTVHLVFFFTVCRGFLDFPLPGFPAVVSNLRRCCLESRCFGLESRRCCLEIMALLFQDVTATVSSRCLCCVEYPQVFSKEREKKQTGQDQNDQMTYVHISLTNFEIINVPVIMFRAFERAKACATGEQVFISLLCSAFDTKLKERKKDLQIEEFRVRASSLM